jgi:putative NIF3 family GTP cyclohydrolase 1 type 2
MDLWPEALKAGCDTLVTGDVRYHRAMDAVEAGLNIVDLGHYGSEAVILTPLAERVRSLLPAVPTTVFEGADIFTSLR